MRFLLYFILTYIFLPFNSTINLITILLYYVILNDDERFSIIFAFFAGLLLDLYYPVALGFNMLVFLLLTEVLIYIKKYFVHDPFTLIIVFVLFYLPHILITYFVFGKFVSISTILLTILLSLPLIFALKKLCFKVWMKS